MPGPDLLRPVEVRVPAQSIARFREVVGDEAFAGWRELIDAAAVALRGRVVWQINSTARGGGVAEMLGAQTGLARDADIDARWMVVAGTPAFFTVTKRLHNRLHADAGDGGLLGENERVIYEQVLRENAAELAAVVRSGDVVVMHDPQTAGLAPPLRRRGATVIWRCHIGHAALDDPLVEEAWAFLRPYLSAAHATVFSRSAYVPAFLRRRPGGRRATGHRPVLSQEPGSLPRGGEGDPRPRGAHRGPVERNGLRLSSRRRLSGPGGPRPTRRTSADTPLVAQVSRWDRLKDHLGLMRAFAGLEAAEAAGAHLVLAGPSVTGVADDPDGPAVLAELTAAWRGLPHEARRRIQIASLPMVDPQENAAMVNALQRHAVVIVQKSLQEGFGLTVTEAMWKGTPVVASAVGGIVDQIDDGVDGVLLDNPQAPGDVAAALRRLLGSDDDRARLGTAGRERVRRHGLAVRLLADDLDLIRDLLA